MADISFPAHITVDRELDVDGLPILTARVTVQSEAATLPLPLGPAGPQGQRGNPRSTFRKMGVIANAAARPTGLGPDDRGKWWHRLDDNGMDVWLGAGWQHSSNAVGPQGPVGPANKITAVKPVHKENLTIPAVEFSGSGAEQQLKVTVPAGFAGPKGPAGASGPISGSPDFEPSAGPVNNGVFAYNRGSQKFRGVPAPLGAGPWSWYENDFAANQTAQADQLIAGSFTIPAQPFAWRPIVYGHLSTYSVNDQTQSSRAVVRLYHAQGDVVASAIETAGVWVYMPIFPTYRDEQATKTMSPTSAYAAVPAGQGASLVVAVERSVHGTQNIGYDRARASLVVYAQPI
ncbi:hypothetical protein [Nocardia arthritidis]|uniref:Minor tail protein n=1 Tax=Nocardia arthritidis TaxID=228602 RepID=A0A6G9YUQ4_9NOCA|nr:hypothetical protein [Nocardia arthritidis]QIS16573.1 hypothetical protein F5544_43850 [Nocardia arthritidis]